MEESDAVLKFWNLPELIERLFSFLNPRSTLRLLQSHVMDKQTLQKSFSSKAWTQLIRRGQHDGLPDEEDVKDLVQILTLLQLEEPNTYLLPLLDLICESSPDVSSPDQQQIVISCPCCSEPHIISTDAFLLLEEVEGALRTAEQSIKSVKKVGCPDVLKAVTSRMSRQREIVTSVTDVRLHISQLASSTAYIHSSKIHQSAAFTTQGFATLMQAQEVFVKFLDIGGAIGGDGWHELAKSLRGRPNAIGKVFILKQDLSKARREDIKDIWESTAIAVGVFYTESQSENGVFHLLEKNHLLVHKSTSDWEEA